MTVRRRSPSSRRSAQVDAAQVAPVMNAIRALVAALSQSARAVEQDTGVTNAQAFVLRELSRDEPLTINDIAARAMTRQSTASLLVTRLVRAGLVRRETDASDARRALVSLTPKGRRLVAKAPDPPTAQVLRALRRLSPVTLERLEHGLAELLDELGLSSTESPPLFEKTERLGARRRAQIR